MSVAKDSQKVLNTEPFHEWQSDRSVRSHQYWVQFLWDVLVEGILDNDIHQMQEFDNENISEDSISEFSPHCLFVCIYMLILNPKAYLEQTNMLHCARAKVEKLSVG